MANYSDVSRIFQALADPTRRAIVARLAHGPAPVGELAAQSGFRLPTILRHLEILEEAGLVASHKQGRVRQCHIVPEAMNPAQRWMEEQREVWESRLDRLERLLRKQMEEGKS